MSLFVPLTSCEVAELVAQRDRARALVIRIEAVCAERERLLWMAIEAPSSFIRQAQIARFIAAHLREHGSVPPSAGDDSC